MLGSEDIKHNPYLPWRNSVRSSGITPWKPGAKVTLDLGLSLLGPMWQDLTPLEKLPVLGCLVHLPSREDRDLSWRLLTFALSLASHSPNPWLMGFICRLEVDEDPEIGFYPSRNIGETFWLRWSCLDFHSFIFLLSCMCYSNWFCGLRSIPCLEYISSVILALFQSPGAAYRQKS